MDLNHESRQSTVTPVGASDELPAKTSSRKSHRKTRMGCRTCKQRKIKCDETRPECKNCQKHSVRCDYVAYQAQNPGRPSGIGFSNHASPSTIGTPQQSDTHLPSFDRFASDALNGQPAPLNLQDLELLHNFSTHTASTLHGDPIIKTLIRTSVPQLGLQYEFVMRGVLAISALHLAHFKPDQKDYYVSQALHHQEIGLRSASAVMPYITDENCSAIYIFSVLTFYISLAKPRGEGDIFLVSEHGAADWLFLIKGTSYIMASSMTSLLSGPFGPLFKAGHRRHESRKSQAEPIPGYDPVLELETLIHNSVYDQGHLELYNSALAGLRSAFVMAYSTPSNETGDVFSWLFQVSDGFLELVRQHLPEALAILGYFCVLLKRLDHYWWVEGWGNHLMSKVYHILDEERRLWIRWPMEEMGWMPK